MATVGDVILAARVEFPDPPQTLSRPSAIALSFLVAAGTWPDQTTVYCVATALNQWGETVATGEVNELIIGSGNALLALVTVQAGTTAIRLYFGTASGVEDQYVQFPAAGAGSYVITVPGPTPTNALAAAPAVINTAFLPDTDGSAIGAYQIYQWLTDGLTELTELTGGILDSTGLQGIAQNMYYVVPGRWYEMTNIRWDNWPAFAGKRNEVFYRIILSGVPTIFTEEGRTSQQIIGSWPAPGASGNQTTLVGGGAGGVGSAMTPTDTSVIVANAQNFTVQQRVLIDNEVILYGQVTGPDSNGNYTLVGLIRGIGGTRAATHQVAAAVTELKITVVGYRYPSAYAVGDAAVTLDIPPAWETPLHEYLLFRYKKSEQDEEGAKVNYDSFAKKGQLLRIQRMGAIRSKQVGPPLLLTDPAGAWEGRILVP